MWGSKCLSVDVATGRTLKCGGFFNARNIALISAGVATAVILTKMGGDDQVMTPETPRTPSAPQAPPAATPQTTPVQNQPATTLNQSGTYLTEITCTNDPSNHNPYIGLSKVRSVTVVITGTNIRITGSDPWVNTSGTYDPATGAFKTSGLGTVAGRSNVSVIFNGTLTPGSSTAKPRLTGAATMGANRELPGGQATTYTVFGNQ
ncbi:MAG: hypothetical protein EXQ55_01265 [Acidobacteria bacterium]|nr:hypothetical protein [Acidobacteriota bacterium]